MTDQTRTEKIGDDFIVLFLIFQIKQETVITPYKQLDSITTLAMPNFHQTLSSLEQAECYPPAKMSISVSMCPNTKKKLKIQKKIVRCNELTDYIHIYC